MQYLSTASHQKRIYNIGYPLEIIPVAVFTHDLWFVWTLMSDSSLLSRLWVSPCVKPTWTLRSWRPSQIGWSSTPRSLLTGCYGWCLSWCPSLLSAWSSSSESSPGSDDDQNGSTLNFLAVGSLCLCPEMQIGWELAWNEPLNLTETS